MPRLIPRLISALKSPSPASKHSTRPIYRPSSRRKCLARPVPPAPDYSDANRSQSLLLDEVNPVIHAKAYVRHKTLPPRPRIDISGVRRTTSAIDVLAPENRPRAMTGEEKQWWTNPYLRMLSSPLRRCIITRRYLPLDFLVRLSPRRLTSPRVSTKRDTYVLLPDGLEHPKFKNRHKHQGWYVLCRKAVLAEVTQRSSHHRIGPRFIFPPSLEQYIRHLLCLRILQELEILAAQLRFRRRGPDEAPVLRRLTRAELLAIRETNTIPFPDGLAILVVPPPNKHPFTKARPIPHTSALPAPDSDSPVTSIRPSPPLSILYPISPTDDCQDLPDIVSTAKIPLYNGIALLPTPSQRAALHERLCRILKVEWLMRPKPHSHKGKSSASAGTRPSGDSKASHAFLLCANGNTLRRADVAPLAIALWRLRMWEEGSWEQHSGSWASII